MQNVGKLPKLSGVYTITNIKTGKLYVGSSINVNKRSIEHYNSLKKGQAVNIYLQRAWNKYGESNFIVQIIEEVFEVELLKDKEQAWLDILKPFSPNGYNISPFAHCPPGGSAYWVIFPPEEDPVLIYGLSKYCREKTLSAACMMKVNIGNCYHHKGYWCRNAKEDEIREGVVLYLDKPNIYNFRNNKTSRYTGVCFSKQKNRWRAVIKIAGKKKHLGYYTNQKEAALAYNDAAFNAFGEKAKLNILVEDALDLEIEKRIGNSKHWIVQPPVEEEVIIYNLKAYCREHNLDASCMSRVASGEIKQHKGYRIVKQDI